MLAWLGVAGRIKKLREQSRLVRAVGGGGLFHEGGQEEGAEVKEAREKGRERKRVERGHGAEPRPGPTQSSRCKNANRAPPTQNCTEETRESQRGKRGNILKQ